MKMLLNVLFPPPRMKFTRISTPKKSKKKSKKRCEKSEATDGDFTSQTRKVIEILRGHGSDILFPETATTIRSNMQKKIHILYRWLC